MARERVVAWGEHVASRNDARERAFSGESMKGTIGLRSKPGSPRMDSARSLGMIPELAGRG
jgi:hypothetical protein